MMTLARRLTVTEAVHEEGQKERSRAKRFCCRETQPSAADLVGPAATPLSSQLPAKEASSGDSGTSGGDSGTSSGDSGTSDGDSGTSGGDSGTIGSTPGGCIAVVTGGG